MTVELLQKKSTFHIDHEMIRRMCVVFYLSGGIIGETKTARHLFASINHHFPEFLSFTYDARFFGLASSEMEILFQEMIETDLLEEAYNVRKNHPIHTTKYLTKSGIETALSKISELESNDKNQLLSIAAECLSNSITSIKLSTAWGFFLGYVSDSLAKDEDIVPSRCKPYHISKPIKLDSIEKLIQLSHDKFSWLLNKLEYDKRSNKKFMLRFTIDEKEITRRYDYLRLRKSDLDIHNGSFKNVANNNESANQFLLSKIQESEEDIHNLVQIRRTTIQSLLNSYPELGSRFVKTTIKKIEKIHDNFSKIEKAYDLILNVFLSKLAEATQKYYQTSDELLVELNVVPNIPFIQSPATTVTIHASEQFKDFVAEKTIGKQWHFGVDFHILDLTQFLPRAYFVETDRTNLVTTSMICELNGKH